MADMEIGWALQVILWFQSWRTPLIGAFSQVFHYLGSEDFYLAILPLVYWCVDAGFGRRLSAVLMLSMWSNAWLKGWFMRPRPFMVSGEVQNMLEETSYGLPSGHTQGTTTLWSTVALQTRRTWVTIAVTALVVLMAVSRMVAGVHFPQDVIGGILFGLVWLGLYAGLEPRLAPWLERQGLWTQIALIAAATAVMLVIHPGLIPVSSPEWLAEPQPLDDLLAGPVTPAAAFLGLGIGFALEVRYVRFDVAGPWWKRVLRYVIGVAGVLALRFGLGALFGLLDGVIGPLILRLIRYTLIGLWAALGAPWLFVITGLAGRHGESDHAE
jgi:membrane-associated phospholipid phosphatase